MPVDLTTIGAYYLDREVLGQVQSEPAFAYSGGTNDDYQWLPITSLFP
jgi:hypothetical protein